MKEIWLVNGVNLGQLGCREVNVYGHERFEDYFKTLQSRFQEIDLHCYQSNREGDIVECLLEHGNVDGIVLNPGAFTHTSIVLADTIKSLHTKVIEVHISNLFGREQYRKHSWIAGCCAGFISGFGLKSYELAILALIT